MFQPGGFVADNQTDKTKQEMLGMSKQSEKEQGQRINIKVSIFTYIFQC